MKDSKQAARELLDRVGIKGHAYVSEACLVSFENFSKLHAAIAAAIDEAFDDGFAAAHAPRFPDTRIEVIEILDVPKKEKL